MKTSVNIPSPAEELARLRAFAEAQSLLIEQLSSVKYLRRRKYRKHLPALPYLALPDYALRLCEQLADCRAAINQLAAADFNLR